MRVHQTILRLFVIVLITAFLAANCPKMAVAQGNTETKDSTKDSKGSVVKIISEAGGFNPTRNDQPFFIKGAGSCGRVRRTTRAINRAVKT